MPLRFAQKGVVGARVAATGIWLSGTEGLVDRDKREIIGKVVTWFEGAPDASRPGTEEPASERFRELIKEGA